MRAAVKLVKPSAQHGRRLMKFAAGLPSYRVPQRARVPRGGYPSCGPGGAGGGGGPAAKSQFPDAPAVRAARNVLRDGGDREKRLAAGDGGGLGA